MMAAPDTVTTTHPLREAPSSAPSPRGIADAAHPNVAQGPHPEPRLEVEQIQGNILPGFIKDYETLLFLHIDDVVHCKRWLKELVALIATADEVLAFSRLFKAIRSRRGHDTNAVKATWINIALSYNALRALTKGGPSDLATAKDFTDPAFKDGLAKRSAGLGDPTDPQAEGNPANWVVGGPHNEADIVLIVQSDDREDLFAQVEQLEDSIYAFRPEGKPAASGVNVIFKQHGANLPGSLSGHEHFGFLDGVSQPGVRGHVSNTPTDVLTPRQNPRDTNQGKPGQDLLWPGEFVFGYEYQDPAQPVEQPSRDTTQTTNPLDGTPVHSGKFADAGPAWARNGSFFAFRRLRQDVGGFHTFLRDQANSLKLSPLLLGAKIVGRWPSGAPLLRGATADNAALGNDDCANNDFEFFHPDPSLGQPAGAAPPDTGGGGDQCTAPALFVASPGDQKELLCPAFGHIRKAYPRDDITPAGAGGATDEDKSTLSEQNTQTHRLLRRGIPYGPASASTPNAPLSDGVDRGLLFAAYQTSIDNQFEFVTRAWVNNPNFKDRQPQAAGFDLVIGQNNSGPDRTRTARLNLDNPNRTETVTAPTDWVIPTGGGYFFAPSITALATVLSQ